MAIGPTTRRFDVGGSPRPRLRYAAAALAVTAVALGAWLPVASGAPKLSASGPANEGPYPWKYPGSGSVKVGSGTTISGQKCTAGAPQFSSAYADPCIAKWSGNNGGATYNGVTATTITLAMRTFPMTANSEEVAAVAKQDGIAVPGVSDEVAKVFINYFNKVYDLYGRHVKLVEEHAVGNATTEALGGGQSQACADADTIAHSIHAFGEVGFSLDPNGTGGGGSGPFSVCAASDGLVEFAGGGYFDEAWYQQYNPYVWDIVQECERIGIMSAQVFGKYLVNKPAIYAGDPALRTKTRVFGTYIPNLPQYLKCLNISDQELESKYHLNTADEKDFTYGLDISTFEQSVQQAIVQFKSEGVTTIIAACDPFSLQLLTQAASAQNYHPEWVLNGAAGNDIDTVAQSFNPAEVTGSLFGMSEASPQNTFFGPTSPAGKLYKKLTGHTIPPGTEGGYSTLVWIFDALQAAGPDLTPQNMARGLHALPTLGAPNYVYGAWSWNAGSSGRAGTGDHTAVTDDRFVYWDANAISPVNQKRGTYIAVFGGKRYSLGNWPSKLPPLFTAPGSKTAS